MALCEIQIKQSFKAPVTTIFDILSDHAQFGDMINTDIRRIKDSDTDYVNGLGSVRSIRIFPTPAFEETITAFVPNELIEYKITKGSPLKNHCGTMEFSGDENSATLNYRIVFESKLPVPFLAETVKFGLEGAIKKGLSQLANSFN